MRISNVGCVVCVCVWRNLISIDDEELGVGTKCDYQYLCFKYILNNLQKCLTIIHLHIQYKFCVPFKTIIVVCQNLLLICYVLFIYYTEQHILNVYCSLFIYVIFFFDLVFYILVTNIDIDVPNIEIHIPLIDRIGSPNMTYPVINIILGSQFYIYIYRLQTTTDHCTGVTMLSNNGTQYEHFSGLFVETHVILATTIITTLHTIYVQI